jgi:acyl-coenzyme A thioesterase PaaI-like protein
MEIKTHGKAATGLLGTPMLIEDGLRAEVELVAANEMAVDDEGLIHGGFTYGLADYAAMLAVNHPFVVLGKSESRFLAPVRAGDVMKAKAEVKGDEGRRKDVEVEVYVGEKKVFAGAFTCYVLASHVLEGA